VFENRILRTVFCPKREEVMERWRKLYNEELHNLCFSDIRVINSRRLRWAEHVEHLGR
jgi:hypothetical protein